MAGHQQPATYKISCIFFGEYACFGVDIAKNKTVSHLQDAIKSNNLNALANITANNLTLHLINLLDDDDLKQNVHQLLNSEAPLKPLDPTDELSDLFPENPAKDTVHILAKLPYNGLRGRTRTQANPSVLLPWISPTHSDKLKEYIAEFEIDLRSKFETFLRNDVQLPVWQSPLGTEAVRDHIAGLKIPLTSPFSESPLLLLHNLGQPSHDALLAERVNNLFLCNASASGKTRLLLEGLWRNWGFYFTPQTQPEGVGSLDLEYTLRNMESLGRLKPLTDKHRDDVHFENWRVANQQFLQILYVRISVFRVFLECASAMPGGITENHKGRWLLIQVAPATLLAEPDIFNAFTNLTGRLNSQSLKGYIESEFIAITQLLSLQPPTLFCVLDEADVPRKKFLDCFLSDTEPAQPRSILHQIILTWREVLPNLIVSGDGVSMWEVETDLGGGVVATESERPPLTTDIGGFDNEVDQRAYLERYLPPGFLNTASGKELASRAGYWLRGRHRFTATYIMLLLETDLESPHQVLNGFVHALTGFRPSGWDDGTVKLTEIYGFDLPSQLERSKKKQELLTTIVSFVFEYTFTGKIRRLGGPDGNDMVELGVSRIKKRGGDDSRIAETDEPLTILRLVTFLLERGLNLERHLREALNVPSLAFEPFGAFLLAHAFSAPRPLSEIFEFVGESEVRDELAELVTLERIDDIFRITPLNLTSNLRLDHFLGCSPSTAAGTLEWLQNPGGSTFCFPANGVGPDLICVLRLTGDGTVLRVCVQFKHPKELGHKAIRTIDPFDFLSPVKASQLTISDASIRTKMMEAIKNLGGKGTEKPGDCGILRVLVSHPSPPDGDTLDKAAKDGHGHPLATIPVSRLKPPDSDLGQTILKLANSALRRLTERERT